MISDVDNIAERLVPHRVKLVRVGHPARLLYKVGKVKAHASVAGHELEDVQKSSSAEPTLLFIDIVGMVNELPELQKTEHHRRFVGSFYGVYEEDPYKARPGTITEALIRGLPIILIDYIPGHEEGNVPYLVGNGAGVFTRSPKEDGTYLRAI
ncbi:1,2-diacylglycerol 3-beta-galactosyltransferase [Artemisia annua]|uniref:1,2-diacylglycerol 3-beta-galactosyltransferase n=1 Tax=Artemisia annua TaxID=35608 RepID=A0A2U1KUW2_ARTAN|nr:1,2-diacylglycerol 3-beta-galactosyltransferase [Artemisia annua]